ncbi:MAG: hypothetical protein C0622_14880 [Desulfuromonas sp.]|nr:MAG: hypothetical protein C0622_14880 [Desulfuromonas sp.]
MTTSLDWQLEKGETLLWQGRPAPRCYTFRHWLQALIGTVLFLASSFWLMIGYHLIREQGLSSWLLALPLVLVIGSFLIGPVPIILARMRWEKVFYALTDRRLLVRNRLLGQRTESYPMNDFQGYKTRKYGKTLLSIRLSFHKCPPVILECIEHPELFIQRLPISGS